MKLQGTRLLSTATLLLCLSFLGGCHDDLYVKTHTGWLKGQWAEDIKGSTRTFLGIPYAKPPVGDLRFAAPTPAQHWKGLLKADAFGASCVQPAGALSASGEQSEDCLTLNVYAPATLPDEGSPVMVFIHGGAFVSGGSSQYDGTRLSQEGNAVVVSLNYRLGALGFFAHPELDQSGNAGLLDQQLALQWVKDNIASFGGNPDNITLFGESAGSASVCVHMVAPDSQSLVNRFIMESGTCIGGLEFLSEDQAQALGGAITSEVCGSAADPIACMREADPEVLVNWGATNGLFGAGWAPTITTGRNPLPAPAIQLFATGQYNHGEVIIGTNKNEWGLFQTIGVAPVVQTVDQLSTLIDTNFGPAAPYVKAEYLPAADPLANLELIRLYTDVVFRCPARGLARVLSYQGTPVWMYSFDEDYAFHAMELPYVFGNPNDILAPVLVEPLRATVQDYWTRFAQNGDPNTDTQPTWPTYGAVSDEHMVLQETSVPGANLAKSACDMWDVLLNQTP